MAIFLAFAATTLTAPVDLPPSTNNPTPTHTLTTTASYIDFGGALDGGTSRIHRPNIVVETPPPYMTINVVNNQGVALSTFQQSATSGTIPVPPPVAGNTLPGIIAAGATAGIAVPTNVSWSMKFIILLQYLDFWVADFKITVGRKHWVVHCELTLRKTQKMTQIT
jgi:hypothetical protein